MMINFKLVRENLAQENLINLLPLSFNFSPARQTELQSYIDDSEVVSKKLYM